MTAINLLDVLDFARRHALRILAWGLGLAIAAYLLAFLIPPSYKATAVILPPEEDELTSVLSPMRRNLSAIGSLGRLGGSYFTQADIALAILRSRRMAEATVKHFDLQKVYKTKKMESAIKALRGNVRIALATDGTISVAVDDRDPARAAEIANYFLSELDVYNREFRSFRGRRTRQFLDSRVAEVDSSLRRAEAALVAYQRRRGSLALPPDARGGGESVANLMVQKTIAEVDLELARQYAPNSDEVRRLDARVRELRRQVGDVPQTQAGSAGMFREVAVLQQVFLLLTSQLEEARIREAMDTPTIQILDPARPAEIPSWPRKSWIAFSGALLGCAIGYVRAGRPRLAPRPA